MDTVKITIEGVAGSGKTVLLRELAKALVSAGHDVTSKDWDVMGGKLCREWIEKGSGPVNGALKRKAQFVIETRMGSPVA